MRSPLAIKLGILVLVLFCLASAFLTILQWRPLIPLSMWVDPVTRYERELEPLKQTLAGEEAVGYLGDHSNPLNANRQRRFQQTQYSLAPIMITDKRPTRYVVSVWALFPELQEEIAKRGLVLVRDFGNEIRLYERKAP